MINLLLVVVLPLCVTANKVWIGGASRTFSEGDVSPNGISPFTVDDTDLNVYFDDNWNTPTALVYTYSEKVNGKNYNVECYCGGTARDDTDSTADPCACDRPSDNLDIYLTKFEALFSGYSKSRYKMINNGSAVIIAINGTYDRGDERIDLTKPVKSMTASAATASATSGSEDGEGNTSSLIRASSVLVATAAFVSALLI